MNKIEAQQFCRQVAASWHDGNEMQATQLMSWCLEWEAQTAEKAIKGLISLGSHYRPSNAEIKAEIEAINRQPKPNFERQALPSGSSRITRGEHLYWHAAQLKKAQKAGRSHIPTQCPFCGLTAPERISKSA